MILDQPVILDQPIIVSTSWGNDSVALVQFLYERGFTDVTCVYCDTGWAASWWPARVEAMETWARAQLQSTTSPPGIAVISATAEAKA